MKSNIGEGRWPMVEDPNDLPKTGERIVLAIGEFEDGWRRETLKTILTSQDNRMLLGPALAELYERMSIKPEESLCRYRRGWIQNALDEFRNAWHAPAVVFQSARTDSMGRHLVLFNGQELPLRNDQVQSVRLWQIGIKSKDLARELSSTNFILRESLSRLASDMACIGRMCRAYASGKLPYANKIQWCSATRGVSFERLVADILNEEERRATRALLFEDLFEWTDLRVKYPDLSRKNGARVQVKLIGDEGLEGQETARWKHPESYVVVSPVRLAEYVESGFGAGIGQMVGDEFWKCLPCEPADTRELASALNRIFHSAIESAQLHPLGPMAQVPIPVRRLVRSYVREGAFGAVERMREAIGERAYWVPRWRSRFSTR